MFGLQLTIVVIIAIVVFVAAAWALIQAFRFPADAYVAAGKRTRTFWLAITGVATLFAFLCLPPASGFNVFFLLETAADRLQLSARAVHRVLRVARTIADLGGAADIATPHLSEALAYRPAPA